MDAMPEEQVKYMTDKIPMKRCGTLEEVAGMSSYIVSRRKTVLQQGLHLIFPAEGQHIKLFHAQFSN